MPEILRARPSAPREKRALTVAEISACRGHKRRHVLDRLQRKLVAEAHGAIARGRGRH